jgi:hypothetical protein
MYVGFKNPTLESEPSSELTFIRNSVVLKNARHCAN